MIKTCKFCGRKFQGRSNRRYCGPKCKKDYENSLRNAPDLKNESAPLWDPSETICKPAGLNATAAAFWDKVAPTVISRGHLNVLSEDAFAELCDLYSKLRDINRRIDRLRRTPGGDPAGDIIGLCDENGEEMKESALSTLKRIYSRQFMIYCQEFYLTPRMNRGNYRLNDSADQQVPIDDIFD